MQTRLYLIGFFYADGCLHTKTSREKHTLSVTISNKDSIITYEFKKIFGGYQYEVNNNGVKYSRWALRDRDIYSELELMGLTPRKTFTLQMPKLDDYRDFIRGYFDGDGSIYLSQHGTITSEIWGTKDFLRQISDILGDEIDSAMKVKVVKGKGKTFRLRFNQTQSILLYRWMYYDNCLSLERKRRRFENGIRRASNLKRTRFMWTEYEDNLIRKYYKKLGPDKILSKMLFPRTKNSIMCRASLLRRAIALP